MFQQDYILRQIQQLIQVIARIIGLRTEGDYEKARTHIEEALKSIWNVHREDLRHLPEAEVLELCMVKGAFHTEFAIALADLLAEDGHIYKDQHNHAMALASYRQSFLINELVLSNSDAAPFDIYDRMAGLEELIASLDPEASALLE